LVGWTGPSGGSTFEQVLKLPRKETAVSRSRKTVILSAAPAVALVAIAVALGLRGDAGHTPLDAGTTTPEFAAVTPAGDSVSLAALRGQPVLLNVWATWCKPCVREMPALERLHQELGPEGLFIVAVSVDNAAFGIADPVHSVQSFAEEFGLTFTILLDPESRIESSFLVVGLPMTFLIDRDGRVVQRIIGEREWDNPEMKAELRKLLEI
jgi:peroxiredoxin